MRQIAYFLILTLSFWSCNKKEDDSFYDLQAIVKENFTDPYKQQENIVVDDYIPYTITIEDSDSKNEKAEYRLTPLYEGQAYHQMLWKDFGLYRSNEDKATLKEEKYISFSKKGTHHFYIHPLVPGTFKLTFELQKFLGGKAVGNPIKLTLSFNVVDVKIIIFKEGIASIFVNDGENETDTYLDAYINGKGDLTAYFKLVARYNNNGGRFIEEGILRNNGILRSVHLFDLRNLPGTLETFEQLTIEQKSGDSSPFVINYYNLKVEKKSSIFDEFVL